MDKDLSLDLAIADIDPQTEKLLAVIDTILPFRVNNAGYPTDPVEFMREVLGVDPWPMQEEITRSVWENRYTSVASCHSIGKSFITAAIVITFLHTHENSIVLTTAPTGRQVEMVLWRNINTIWHKAKRPLLGRPPLTTRYDIDSSWYAIGFKPNTEETDPMQGFHADDILAIVDEAAGAPPNLINGMMAAMTSRGARFMMIGNPTSTSGPFYDSHHSKKHMFKTYKVAWPDTPNFKDPEQNRWPGLITQQWVEEQIEREGLNSPFVQSRIFAEWVSSDDVLIAQADIERAQNKALDDFDSADLYPVQAGLDVARDGQDKTVLTVRKGQWVQEVIRITNATDGWEVAGKVLRHLADHYPDCRELKIDEIGVGSSVLDAATHAAADFPEFRHVWIRGVNFSRKPWAEEKYRNQRCEAYGMLANRFKSGAIGGHIPDETGAELSDIKYTFDGRHTQAVIESKEDWRARHSRSPDYADSLVLAFYDPPPEEDKVLGVLAFGAAKQRWGKSLRR
jgi:phage terminase large subunit